MRISDWSSDVGSSDLAVDPVARVVDVEELRGGDLRQADGGDVAGIAAASLVHLLIDALWLQRHLVEVRLAQHVLLAMLALPLPVPAVLQLALRLPPSRHRDDAHHGPLGTGDTPIPGRDATADLTRCYTTLQREC